MSQEVLALWNAHYIAVEASIHIRVIRLQVGASACLEH